MNYYKTGSLHNRSMRVLATMQHTAERAAKYQHLVDVAGTVAPPLRPGYYQRMVDKYNRAHARLQQYYVKLQGDIFLNFKTQN